MRQRLNHVFIEKLAILFGSKREMTAARDDLGQLTIGVRSVTIELVLQWEVELYGFKRVAGGFDAAANVGHKVGRQTGTGMNPHDETCQSLFREMNNKNGVNRYWV